MKHLCIVILSALLALYGSVNTNIGMTGILSNNMVAYGTIMSVQGNGDEDGACSVKFVFKDSHDRYHTGEEAVTCGKYKALMCTNIYYNHFAPEVKASTHSDMFIELPVAVSMALSGIASLSLGFIMLAFADE